ncbi:MAG: hypothetical protein PHC69_07070 [Ruminiclostridium sp.]|nr:hypothetical protein [Ruminiclostridium sp.]
MDQKTGVQFLEDDYYAVDIAKSVAYMLLNKVNLTPKQIISIGNALSALERFLIAVRNLIRILSLFIEFANF